MNVLLINYEYPPLGAGAANATYYIARALVERGHSATVLTSGYRDKLGSTVEEGVKILRCRCIRKRKDQSNIFEMLTFIIAASFSLRKVIKSRNIEAAIVFFSIPCGPLGLIGRYFYRIPYVISLRGGDVPGTELGLKLYYTFLQPFRRLVLKKSLAVIANSQGLKDLSEKADPFSVQIIPNGVDTSYFRPGNKQKYSSRKVFNLLFVGRFRDQKNLFFLFDQLAELRKAAPQSFVLHLVGNGPHWVGLQKHSVKLGLKDHIIWYGWLDKEKLLEMYQSVDCLINPSIYEGMPNVVLEAMSCALPVVASNVAGNDAVVKHGETGFLFDLNQPEELIAALQNFLKNPDLAVSMGLKGRESAVNDFSWDIVTQEYIRIFQRKKSQQSD